MEDTNSLIAQRKAKLTALRARGIDPFSAKNKFTPSETCAAARAAYAEGREVALAGRVTAHRDMGKSMFLDLRDQSDRLQIYAQKNVLGDEQFSIFQHLDLADFIGVSTSTNPRLCRKFRISRMISLRMRNTSFTSGFAIKSR